jgi:DNA repair exonuclease SbcCD nuclease subunit
MRFSILHISDLHRDLTDEINNKWLLDSLETDFRQFESQTPAIQKPSLCIVSGDLIYGVRAAAADAQEELVRQYAQAEEFLIGLADRFFSRNRGKVVIIPGNHDVSYNDVMGSAAKIDIPTDPKVKDQLVRELFSPNSSLRWSWTELCFYKITDHNRYLSRLRHFADTYERFYEGKRTYPLEPEKQFDVFDFPEHSFCVAALNSCFNNDPLRRSGAFHPVALTEICRLLRQPKRAGWLAAATWHHNLTGGPYADDYLDSQFVQILIDAGVSLGFHGHQHLPECFDERYRIGPSPRKMTVISASTLCAEPKNLKPGVPRSYNVVELNPDTSTGCVHQRQMINMEFNLPIWGPGHFTSTNSSHFGFTLCGPLDTRPPRLDSQLLLATVDEHIGRGKTREALEVLESIRELPLARPFLVRALNDLGEPRTTINKLWPPQTVPEAVTIGGAILEVGSKDEALEFRQLPIVLGSTDASLLDVSNRIYERRLR